MKKGTGMDEKGTARERNPILPGRQKKLFVFAAMALMGMFLLQIATYSAIEDFDKRRLFLRDCGNRCRNEKPPVSTFSAPLPGREKEHERKAFETQKNNENSVIDAKKSMLMIGGSDGSGTRAIVEVLRELGTIVVSEDPQTFDVAAEEVFHSSFEGHVTRGWPSLVERFVSSFGREGFFESISGSKTAAGISETFCWPPPNQAQQQPNVANRLQADVSKLLVHWNDLYNNMIRNKQRIHARLSTGYVQYGIKAPASMLVLPIFAYMQQQQESQPRRLKFLHVLRDGRDVALSDNQSPVIKFYNLTYPPNHLRRKSLASFVVSGFGGAPADDSVMHAKAMQLWNDWNINVHQWATKHSGIDIDYMWIRSEDLLVSESPERLDALTGLARFVGSTITPKELCGLWRKDTMDYGQSVNTASRSIFHSRLGAGEVDILSKWELQNEEKQKQERPGRRRLMEEKQMGRFEIARTNPSVQSRYGKWKNLLENKPGLRDFFYQEGREGLNLFRYHPHRQIRYTDSDLPNALCGDSIDD